MKKNGNRFWKVYYCSWFTVWLFVIIFPGKDSVSIKPSSLTTASAYYSDEDLASSIKSIEIKDKKSGYFILG